VSALALVEGYPNTAVIILFVLAAAIFALTMYRRYRT
jgi:hypothetical protein